MENLRIRVFLALLEIDARLFERIRRMQARFDALADRVAAAYAEVPPAEGLAEIAAAAAEVRKKKA